MARSLASGTTLARDFFFDAPDLVARRLLGKLLVRAGAEQARVGRIVEVEAYFGEADAAAHAFAGKTARNACFSGRPGTNLQIQDDGFKAGEILVTPRIGISKEATRQLRFLLAGNPFVSKYKG